MEKLLIIFFLFFFKEQQDQQYLLVPGERAGLIRPNDSEADLIKKFGKKNVLTTLEHLEYDEPPEQYVTTIFPKSKNELTVYWKDHAKRQSISYVVVYSLGGQWHLESGVKIGTTLEELEKINADAVDFLGFTGYELQGEVHSWNNGKLSILSAGIVLEYLSYEESFNHAYVSSKDVINKKGIVVAETRIRFNN